MTTKQLRATRSAATTDTGKPFISQLEKPQQIVMKPPLEQTPKKIETYLPTTGGKAENQYIKIH